MRTPPLETIIEAQVCSAQGGFPVPTSTDAAPAESAVFDRMIGFLRSSRIVRTIAILVSS